MVPVETVSLCKAFEKHFHVYFVLLGPETGSPLPVLQIISFIILLAKKKNRLQVCKTLG